MRAGTKSTFGPPPRHGAGPSDSPTRSSIPPTLRALIVEDNAGDAFLVEDKLRCAERWSISVQVAGTLRAAEEVLSSDEDALDLVFLDMRLPDGDGLDALARILAARPKATVVVVTGLDDDSLARACLEAGAVDYIRKSALLGREFVRTIDYALARSRNMRLKTQLESVSRLAALGEVAAGVAHEINNPATYVAFNITDVQRSLTGLSGTLADTDASLAAKLRDLAATLEIASEGVDRITRVVRELQDHVYESTSEIGDTTDPVSAARSSLRLVEHQVRQSASIETDFAACPTISIHPHRFGQVVANLVLNAAQAVRDSAESHAVRVSLWAETDAVLLQVSDDGAGIPQAELPRIFESFHTSKRKRGGTGLGLSIVREIVTAAGGSIEVESEEGSGTVFSVRIPLAREPQIEAEALPARSRSGRRRVLLIDDDARVLAALERGLRPHHDVWTAASGQAALTLLDSLGGEVDVILCDLMMPGMDGEQTLSEVFVQYPALGSRAAVLSGGATTVRQRSFLATTAIPIITKPTRLVSLLNVIDAAASPDL